jgi:hypothetical protein
MNKVPVEAPWHFAQPERWTRNGCCSRIEVKPYFCPMTATIGGLTLGSANSETLRG